MAPFKIIVGCGNKKVPDGHIAVDINEGYIKESRLKSSTNVHHLMADARSLPFKTGVFNELICWEVMEHIREKDDVLQEFHRILTPKGRVVISTAIKEVEKLLGKLSANYREDVTNGFHIHATDSADFLKLVSKHFSITKVKYDSRAMSYWFVCALLMDHYDARVNDAGDILGIKSRQLEKMVKMTHFLMWPLFKFLNLAMSKKLSKSIVLNGIRI